LQLVIANSAEQFSFQPVPRSRISLFHRVTKDNIPIVRHPLTQAPEECIRDLDHDSIFRSSVIWPLNAEMHVLDVHLMANLDVDV